MRWPRRPRDDRADPRFHGAGARARHHHQGADGAPRIQGPERRDLSDQPHGHSRPRRFHLRGQPLAGRLRGLTSIGRRDARRRGADAGQRVPGHRSQSRNPTGVEQDRPFGCRTGPHPRADIRSGGARHLRRPGNFGQDRPRRRRRARSPGRTPAGARGRFGSTAEGAAGRQLVRPVPGGDDPGSHQGRGAEERHEDPDDGVRRLLSGRTGRPLHAEAGKGQGTRSRRDRIPDRRHQGRRRYPSRRHHHRGQAPGQRSAARLQAVSAGGVLRPVPGRFRRLRGLARQLGQAPPQRRKFPLRGRNIRRAGLRLPLRVLRVAAPGNHPTAPGARVRPRLDYYRAQRRLPYPHPFGRDEGTAQSGRFARPDPHRFHRGTVDQRHHHRPRRILRIRAGAVHGAQGRADGAHLRRPARHAALPVAVKRGGHRFLRPAEIGVAWLRQLRLRTGGLRRRQIGQSIDPGQFRTGGRAQLHRPLKPRRKPRPRHL